MIVGLPENVQVPQMQTCICSCFLVNNCLLECVMLVAMCPVDFLHRLARERWMSQLGCCRVYGVHLTIRDNKELDHVLGPCKNGSSHNVIQSLLQVVETLVPWLCFGPCHLQSYKACRPAFQLLYASHPNGDVFLQSLFACAVRKSLGFFAFAIPPALHLDIP